MDERYYCKFFGAYAKVYCLCDINGNVFYVGCTVKPLEIRLARHAAEARQNKVRTAKTVKIKALNYRVGIKELEALWVTGRNPIQAVNKARSREKYWIYEMSNRGYNLANKEVQQPKNQIDYKEILRKIRGNNQRGVDQARKIIPESDTCNSQTK